VSSCGCCKRGVIAAFRGPRTSYKPDAVVTHPTRRAMKTALGLLAVATFLVAPSLSAAQSRAQSDVPAVGPGLRGTAQ